LSTLAARTSSSVKLIGSSKAAKIRNGLDIPYENLPHIVRFAIAVQHKGWVFIALQKALVFDPHHIHRESNCMMLFSELTTEVIVTTIRLNRHPSFGTKCVQCGDEQIAPERPEYWNERHAFHIWLCPKCSASVASRVSLPADNTPVRDVE